MKTAKKWFVWLLAISLVASMWGCVVEGEVEAQEPASEEVAQVKGEAADVYQKAVEPLTTLECAQCHYSVFKDIKDQGGKHQLQCRYCHQTFHALRPGIPWKDVIPQCTTCHGEIHGPEFLDCLACHSDPHAPIASLVNLESLAKGCKACHGEQNAEVQKYVSAHTEVACEECHHTQHGYKPGCLECHPEPHTTYVDNASCEACHPVHSPLEIAYDESTSNGLCAGCHGDVTDLLASSSKKHSTLQCVFCHADKHRYIPECSKCHGVPHSETLLQKFSGCSDCHGDPHALKMR